ncbi:MAG: ATPase V, partial [Bacteroidales bacterium]|nr:ATPase V [Bacteroidales bacterium]
ADDLPGEIAAPDRPLSAAESELAATTSRTAALESRLKGLQTCIPDLEKMRDGLVSQLDLYLAGVSGNAVAEDYVLTFEGFAPQEKESEIAARLDALGALYIKGDAKVEENPPIAFKNNAFVRMFEMLTDMYGRPSYNGFDPTPYISIFFMLFFAFCMGDCGYGLVLMAVALLLKKADAFKSLAPLVLTLGGATVIIGFLFHTFFSIDIADWSIFEPIKGVFLPSKIMGYDGTMVLSLLVGILHICLALIVKTIMATKNQGFLGSLGTWGWTLLIVGGIIIGGISLAGVLSSEVTQGCIIVLGVLSGLGIFLLNDLHRNPLKNIGSGLWATYNTVTGLLGDVLSYLRLYALGLAGCMLGLAFNKIGMMVLGDGADWYLWIPFVLIVLVGHTLNVAMCALGAFVHPLRLNFLEFFKNSGYEAQGRKYNPLTKNN